MPVCISQWFLTYPQCEATKEQLLEHVKTVDTVVHYLIASELHEDGGKHLHAYLKFEKGILKTKFKIFDFLDYHGNYQPCRSCKNVIKYCKKDGNYICNFDIDLYLQKKGKISASTIKTKSVKDVIESGEIHFTQARAFVFAKGCLMEPYSSDDVRGIWFYGPPGTGKTHLARELFPNAYIKAQNKWYDGYCGEGAIILDDYDCIGLTHLLKIWADKWSCSGEVKGGKIPLNHRWFVVTSNYTIREIVERETKKDKNIDQNLIEALERRFNVHEFTSQFVGPEVGKSGKGTWVTGIDPEIDRDFYKI